MADVLLRGGKSHGRTIAGADWPIDDVRGVGAEWYRRVSIFEAQYEREVEGDVTGATIHLVVPGDKMG